MKHHVSHFIVSSLDGRGDVLVVDHQILNDVNLGEVSLVELEFIDISD